MPSNVEIKARLTDPAGTRRRAEAIADHPARIIRQTDTFFACARGRLKLRDFGDGSGELIFYDRPDAPGPKTSRYAISRTTDPEGLAAVLAAAYRSAGVVRKRRTLLLAGRTRIHLDEVEGLGEFLELEVVLAEGEPAAAGEAEAQALMKKLGVAEADLVTGAYVDLLAAIT